jgi:hypothetical protein
MAADRKNVACAAPSYTISADALGSVANRDDLTSVTFHEVATQVAPHLGPLA